MGWAVEGAAAVVFDGRSIQPDNNLIGLSLFGVGEWVGGVVVLVG